MCKVKNTGRQQLTPGKGPQNPQGTLCAGSRWRSWGMDAIHRYPIPDISIHPWSCDFLDPCMGPQFFIIISMAPEPANRDLATRARRGDPEAVAGEELRHIISETFAKLCCLV